MSNKMRWRYGETNPVIMPVPLGFKLSIGDLVYLDSGHIKPATDMSDQGSLTANQELFHDNFVGVAMQSSDGTAIKNVRVATSGVFEFDCVSSTYDVGDLLGVNEDATGLQLQDQSIIDVATVNLAIGRCVKKVDPAGSKVLIDVVSTVVKGGPQAAA